MAETSRPVASRESSSAAATAGCSQACCTAASRSSGCAGSESTANGDAASTATANRSPPTRGFQGSRPGRAEARSRSGGTRRSMAAVLPRTSTAGVGAGQTVPAECRRESCSPRH